MVRLGTNDKRVSLNDVNAARQTMPRMGSGSHSLGNLNFESSKAGPLRTRPSFPTYGTLEAIDYTQYFSIMKTDPLATIDECKVAFVSLDRSFRRQRYELIALIYGFATLARADEDLRHGFMQKQFWEGRTYKLSEENILRLAMQFCLEARQGSTLYHRALTYARALSGFFEDGQPMEDIPDLIEEAGGIEKLALNNRGGSSYVEQVRSAAKNSRDAAAVQHLDSSANEDDEKFAGTGKKTRKISSYKPTINLDEQILIESSEKLMSKLFAQSDKKNFKIWGTIEKDDDGWYVLRAKSVKRFNVEDVK